MTQITVEPKITATAEIRRASSSCHGAKLSQVGNVWLCQSCMGACDRILSEPELVELSNG